MKKHIAVIGGGIVGSTAGYYLARAGHQVTLFDEGTGQATSAAAGIICPWFSRRRNKKWYQLVRNGAAFYQQLLSDLENDGFDTGFYSRCGTVILKKSAEYQEEMYRLGLKRREEAPEIGEIRKLSEAELQQLLPTIRTTDHAVFAGGGARVDGEKLVETLQKAIIHWGGRIRREPAGLRLTDDRPAVFPLADPDGFEQFDAAVAAVGAWLPRLLKPLGYETDIRGQKGQLLILQTGTPNSEAFPVVMPQGEIDILPYEKGKAIIGASHENEKGYDLEPDAAVLSRLLQEACAFFPHFSQAKIETVRVGTRAYTSDFSPFFGAVPHAKDLYAASGLGSSGLTSGPVIGHYLAQLIQGEPIPVSLDDYPAAGYITRI